MPALNENICKIKKVLLQRHANLIKDKSYLPLTGKIFTQKKPIDLKLLVSQFLTNQTKVLLLQGSAGTGKTTFCHQLIVQLLTSKEPDSIIPIYISLRPEHSKSKDLVEPILQDHKFLPEQVVELKQTQKFLFILDDFEQLRCFQNIYLTHQLDEWQAKIIVVCRPEYFVNTKNYQYYFIPYQAGKSQPHLFKEINLVPSSKSLWSSLKDKPIGEFFNNWIAYHKERYRSSNVFEKELLAYCTQIAHEMQQKKTTKIIYRSASRLFDNSRNDWQKYFDPKLTVLRMAAPIVKTGENQYEFIRADLLLYFAAKKPELADTKSTKPNDGAAKRCSDVFVMNDIKETIKAPNYLLNHYLNKKIITHDINFLQLLSSYVVKSRAFKKELFDLMYASRENESMAIGAANAITILNAARVSFVGLDLAHIKIPHADLSEAVLDEANLQSADLRKTTLRNAWLRRTNLTSANLTDVQFGSYPITQFPDAVRSCCYSVDGYRLVIASGKDVYLHDSVTGENEHTLPGHTDTINSVAISPNNQFIISGSNDCTVRMWDIAKRTCNTLKKHSMAVTCLVYNPVNAWQFVSGGKDKLICLWTIGESVKVRSIPLSSAINSTTFSPDGKHVAVGLDSVIYFWDITANVKPTSSLELKKKGPIWRVMFNPQGTFLAFTAYSIVYLLDIQTKNIIFSFQVKPITFTIELAFNSDGKILIIASNNEVKLVDIEEKNLIQSFKTSANNIKCVAFSHDDEEIIAGCDDGTLFRWRVEAKNYHFYEQHKAPVNAVNFAKENKVILSGCDGSKVLCWEANTGKLLDVFKLPAAAIKGEMFTAFYFGFKDLFCFTVGSSNFLYLWNIATKQLVNKIDYKKRIACMALSKDGKQFALSFTKSKVVMLYHFNANNAPINLESTIDDIACLTFSLDGKFIMGGGWNGIVYVWNAATRKLEHTFKTSLEIQDEKFGAIPNKIRGIDISFDNKYVASGGLDKVLYLWNTGTGVLQYELKAHKKGIAAVAFDPSGKWIASGSTDYSLRLWAVASGQCIAVIKDYMDIVSSICWGKFKESILLVTNDEAAIKCWELTERGDRLDRKLLWANRSMALEAEGACIDKVDGLTETQSLLLKQRGAIGIPHTLFFAKENNKPATKQMISDQVVEENRSLDVSRLTNVKY